MIIQTSCKGPPSPLAHMLFLGHVNIRSDNRRGLLLIVLLFPQTWFAYVSLQDITAEMKCPTCRDSPYALIADGVGIAFSKEKLSSTLHPPTVCSLETSRERHQVVVFQPGPQLFGPRKLRDQVRGAIKAIDVLEVLDGDRTSRCRRHIYHLYVWQRRS